jgi:DNA-binding NarL/FixJ family response regulator
MLARTSQRPRNILLLHDGSLVMRGALNALESADQMFSVTDVHSLAEVQDKLATGPHRTEILVVGLPRSLDPTFLAHLRTWSQTVLVLVISRVANRDLVATLVTTGVHGYLDMDVDPEALFAALDMIAKGRFFLAGSAKSDLFSGHTESTDRSATQPTPPVPSELTERESQVLGLVADGWTHKEISSRLGLSKATIDTYVQRIRQKLGLRNKAELTRAAVRFGVNGMGKTADAD